MSLTRAAYPSLSLLASSYSLASWFSYYITPSFALPHGANVHHYFPSASPIPWSPIPLVSLLGRTLLLLRIPRASCQPGLTRLAHMGSLAGTVTTSSTSTVESEKWLSDSIWCCRILTTRNVGLGYASSFARISHCSYFGTKLCFRRVLLRW